MPLVACLGLSLLLVPLRGGSLSALADIRFRHPWALAAAFGLQLLALSGLAGTAGVLPAAAHLGSYVLGADVLIANRRLPGLPLIALGAALNLAAIAANGGIMPASEWAVATAGIQHSAGEFHNSAVLTAPRLLILGDVFAIPRGWVLHNVFSIGDVCLAAGAALTVQRTCRPPGKADRPAARTAPA